jgi:hypothetical protein
VYLSSLGFDNAESAHVTDLDYQLKVDQPANPDKPTANLMLATKREHQTATDRSPNITTLKLWQCHTAKVDLVEDSCDLHEDLLCDWCWLKPSFQTPSCGDEQLGLVTLRGVHTFGSLILFKGFRPLHVRKLLP